MNEYQPLVSIGIPTYNRAILLKRSIESALNQNYSNIEIIVSDNASTDKSEDFCQFYCDRDARVKYFRHSSNFGPAVNFSAVLERSTGQYFMWLGDDDWIDEAYVSTCIQYLIFDKNISLVSGKPEYYRGGQKSHNGKLFDLLQNAWWLRVISYYWKVEDNGMFYGLMRSSQIKQIKMPNTMGGDWNFIANIVSFGKSKCIQEISVHRELGGATTSYQNIAASLGISKIHAIFPMSSIAMSTWLDIMAKGMAYKAHSALARLTVACVVFTLIMAKSVLMYFSAATRRIRRCSSKLVG